MWLSYYDLLVGQATFIHFVYSMDGLFCHQVRTQLEGAYSYHGSPTPHIPHAYSEVI